MTNGQLAGQPILILKEGTTRTRGRDAQANNILAGKIVAEAVRTTLGPKGMDKMLVDSFGDVVITNDGATILKEMDIAHPAAKMIVEVAKTQDEEVGDGTTTAVVLAGELLKKAEELIEQNVHPTVVARGYRLAADKAIEILNSLAFDATINDEKILEQVATTALTGKGTEIARDTLSSLVVKAVKAVAEKKDGKYAVDKDDIKIEKRVGGKVEDTALIDGIVIDKERVHSGMPKKVKDAKIALIADDLEVKKTKTDAEISIKTPDQLRVFLDEEERILKSIADKIIATGANVVICQKGIEDLVQHYLAKAGILAVRRVKESDMKLVAKATGANIVSSIEDLTKADLGFAGLVEEKKTGTENMIYITQCKNPKSVTILVRGGTQHIIDELERAIQDGLRVVEAAIEDEKVVAGGGAPEVELALRIREYASKLTGREQLAVLAFADAMEIIPKTLAENSGLDPIDTLVDLRASHEVGNKTFGLNVYTGKPMDMKEAGVIEPLRAKTQAVLSATEAASMILRIDDVIAASKAKESTPSEGPSGEGEFD
jgi:thermosome